MAWQPNVTSMTKNIKKSSMFVEYNYLIKELEEYMPQFKASVKDLQEPSQTFVSKFYTDVLLEFFCDVNNLTEIQVTQNLTYNEMYCETVPILNMCIALKYIYSKLGIDDFGMSDICDPSSKRTYCLLQTMINFIKFSDGKISEVDEKMKAIRNMKDTYDKLKKEKDFIVNSINKKTLERKDRESELKILAEDLKSCKSELMHFQKLRDDRLNELDEIKQEQCEIEKKCSKLSELKDNIVRDINVLRAKIVEAPDLLKADHERLKRLKNEISEKRSLMMGKINAKKQTVIILEQELVAIEKRFHLLTDVIEKNDKLLKLIKEVDNSHQKNCESDEALKSLKKNIEIIECERADINSKINFLVEELEGECNLYKHKFDALYKEIDNKTKQNKHLCETVTILQSDMSSCQECKKELEDKVSTCIESYEKTIAYLFEIQKNIKQKALKICFFGI